MNKRNVYGTARLYQTYVGPDVIKREAYSLANKIMVEGGRAANADQAKDALRKLLAPVLAEQKADEEIKITL